MSPSAWVDLDSFELGYGVFEVIEQEEVESGN